MTDTHETNDTGDKGDMGDGIERELQSMTRYKGEPTELWKRAVEQVETKGDDGVGCVIDRLIKLGELQERIGIAFGRKESRLAECQFRSIHVAKPLEVSSLPRVVPTGAVFLYGLVE